MKKQKIRKKTNYLRIIIIVIIIGLAVWGVFAVMSELSKSPNNSANNSDITTPQQEEDPIKSEDPGNTNDITGDKDITGGSDKPTAPTIDPDTNLKKATVEITDARAENGRVSASGQATNVAETTGTCTYVFTNAQTGTTITESTEILPSPSYTVCAAVSIAQSQFSAGKWSVVLKYNSSSSKGESNSVSFQVQ